MSQDVDEGVGDEEMVDWIRAELEFYGSKAGDDSLDPPLSSDRADSAISVSTPRRSWPVRRATQNKLSKDGKEYQVTEASMKRAALMDISASEYKLRGANFILSDKTLITHLLDLLDLPPSERFPTRLPSDTADTPLYYVLSDNLSLDERYRFEDKDPRKAYGQSMVRNLGLAILPTRVRLNQIIDFVNLLKGLPEKSGFWEVFLSFLELFLLEYSEQVDVLRCEDIPTVALLLCAMADLQKAVDLIHLIVSPHFGKYSWTWKHIEHTWEMLYRLWAEPPQAQSIVLCQLSDSLQRKMFPFLLRCLDRLCSECEVPKYLKDHWFFEGSAEEDSLLKCHMTKEHTARSLIWTDEILNQILTGVKSRSRLNAQSPSATAGLPSLYDTFEAHLNKRLEGSKKNVEDAEEQEEYFYIQTEDLREALHSAIREVTKATNDLLFRQIQAKNLIGLWRDLEEVTIGNVAEHFSRYLYGYSIDWEIDSAQAFMWAVQRHISKPNQEYFRWLSLQKRFICQTSRPVSYIIREAHVHWMNECFTFMHQLFRAKEILVSVQHGENWIMSSRVQDELVADAEEQEHQRQLQQVHRLQREPSYECSSRVASSESLAASTASSSIALPSVMLIRRCQYLIAQLIDILGFIKEIFYLRVKMNFETTRRAFEKATSIEEIERAANSVEQSLRGVVERVGPRKAVHDIIENYKATAEMLNLKAVCLDYRIAPIEEAEKKLERSLEYFDLIAKSIKDATTLFHIVSAKLKYEPIKKGN